MLLAKKIFKKFKKQFLPILVIGVFGISFYVIKKTRTEKNSELHWPTDWNQFNPTRKEIKEKWRGLKYHKKWPCDSRFKDLKHCEKIKKYRTIKFEENLEDACKTWSKNEVIRIQYAEILTEYYQKFNRLDSPKRENSKFFKKYNTIYPQWAKIQTVSFANYIEVLRQSDIKDWKMYSRWSDWGVGDLYHKNLPMDYRDKLKIKYFRQSVTREAAKLICQPFVDINNFDESNTSNYFQYF